MVAHGLCVAHLYHIAPVVTLSSTGPSAPRVPTGKCHVHGLTRCDGLQWLDSSVVIVLLTLLYPYYRLRCHSGNRVLHGRPKRRCAGLVVIPLVGVLRQSSRTKNSDWPESLHFFNNHFTVLTATSVLSLDCEYLGDDVT